MKRFYFFIFFVISILATVNCYGQTDSDSTEVSQILTFGLSTSELNEEIVLEWSINTKGKDIEKFIIQRSPDALSWNNIAEMQSYDRAVDTLHKFFYIDKEPFGGTSYYRIRQENKDGKFYYSNLITAQYKEYKKLIVYPNPAFDEIQLRGGTTFRFNGFAIYDRTGELMKESEEVPATIEIDDLPPGVYHIISGRAKGVFMKL